VTSRPASARIPRRAAICTLCTLLIGRSRSRIRPPTVFALPSAGPRRPCEYDGLQASDAATPVAVIRIVDILASDCESAGNRWWIKSLSLNAACLLSLIYPCAVSICCSPRHDESLLVMPSCGGVASRSKAICECDRRLEPHPTYLDIHLVGLHVRVGDQGRAEGLGVRFPSRTARTLTFSTMPASPP